MYKIGFFVEVKTGCQSRMIYWDFFMRLVGRGEGRGGRKGKGQKMVWVVFREQKGGEKEGHGNDVLKTCPKRKIVLK